MWLPASPAQPHPSDATGTLPPVLDHLPDERPVSLEGSAGPLGDGLMVAGLCEASDLVRGGGRSGPVRGGGCRWPPGAAASGSRLEQCRG